MPDSQQNHGSKSNKHRQAQNQLPKLSTGTADPKYKSRPRSLEVVSPTPRRPGRATMLDSADKLEQSLPPDQHEFEDDPESFYRSAINRDSHSNTNSITVLPTRVKPGQSKGKAVAGTLAKKETSVPPPKKQPSSRKVGGSFLPDGSYAQGAASSKNSSRANPSTSTTNANPAHPYSNEQKSMSRWSPSSSESSLAISTGDLKALEKKTKDRATGSKSAATVKRVSTPHPKHGGNGENERRERKRNSSPSKSREERRRGTAA